MIMEEVMSVVDSLGVVFMNTDAKGNARLGEVPYGSYVFHADMMCCTTN